MQAYQDVSSSLLRLRRAAAVLDELWADLVQSPGACDASSTMYLWADFTRAPSPLKIAASSVDVCAQRYEPMNLLKVDVMQRNGARDDHTRHHMLQTELSLGPEVAVQVA